MQRILHGVTYALFALLAYLIAVNIVSYWVELPAPGNIGFVLVFTLFSVLHCGLMLGRRGLALFFGLSFVISFIMEELGVRTGLIFGPYHYSDMLGPKLSNVPLLIPLGWFMMIYPSWVVARAILRGTDVRQPAGLVMLALVAALVMTGWDMVMDPPMVAGGNWIWEQGGPYFGVPRQNYFGWVLNTFLIYVAFAAAYRAMSGGASPSYRFGGLFPMLPVLVYIWFSIEYIAPGRMEALQVVAVFSMAMPGVLALARLVLPEAAPEPG